MRDKFADVIYKPSSVKKGRTIQSVDRAFDVIEVLARQTGELPLKEIAKLSNLNVSTCHHILHTMQARGYIAQDPRTRTYSLGNRIFALSNARSRQIDVIKVAMPYLQRLNEVTKETVHLGQLQGQEMAVLAKLEALHAVRVDVGQVGKSSAVHATATGKAILAWLPEADVQTIISKNGMTRYTSKTITTMDALRENLRLVRRRGYAIDEEEFQTDVVCVGTAIRNQLGATVASIAVSAPTMRTNEAQLLHYAESVQDAAQAVSKNLGSEFSQ